MFLPKLRLKHKKTDHPLTPEELRTIVKEEINEYGVNSKKQDMEERHKAMLKQRLDNLPKHTKLKLLRYMANKKGEHGKK